jgi:hypothetical protein
MEEETENIQTLKELIHDIKLKDAITRQDLMKAEREGQLLRESILKAQKEIQKLEKDLKKDERLLVSQEENIVNATITINMRKKNRRNDNSLVQESIDRQEALHKTMKQKNEDFCKFLLGLRRKMNQIESLLKENNTNETMIRMRELINYFEEFLLSVDSAGQREESLYEEELKFYQQQLLLYEKQLNELDHERMTEMKKLYDLETRGSLSESDKVIYSKNVDIKTEQVAIHAAENILAKLKAKLSDSSALDGVVSKIDKQISKHKKRVIQVDLTS